MIPLIRPQLTNLPPTTQLAIPMSSDMSFISWMEAAVPDMNGDEVLPATTAQVGKPAQDQAKEAKTAAAPEDKLAETEVADLSSFLAALPVTLEKSPPRPDLEPQARDLDEGDDMISPAISAATTSFAAPDTFDHVMPRQNQETLIQPNPHTPPLTKPDVASTPPVISMAHHMFTQGDLPSIQMDTLGSESLPQAPKTASFPNWEKALVAPPRQPTDPMPAQPVIAVTAPTPNALQLKEVEQVQIVTAPPPNTLGLQTELQPVELVHLRAPVQLAPLVSDEPNLVAGMKAETPTTKPVAQNRASLTATSVPRDAPIPAWFDAHITDTSPPILAPEPMASSGPEPDLNLGLTKNGAEIAGDASASDITAFVQPKWPSEPNAPHLKSQVAAPANLHNQLLAHVASATDRQVELALTPDDLGHVKFQIRHQGDSVTVMLTAERDDTLDMLKRHGDELTREFRDAGFAGATLDFGRWGQQQQSKQPPPAFSLPDDFVQAPTQHRPATPIAPQGDLQGLNLRL